MQSNQAISFVKIVINSIELLVNQSFSVLEACKYAGFHIPRFCYHELLSVAGNCRMCLVELVGSTKPLASCVTPVTPNMQILLDTPLVFKARENVLETLLLNHPLDCPICDQGGECDLQDQAEKFGSDASRHFFIKRSVENKIFNPLVSTIMTRCIHCTRCIRFSAEILGSETLGLLNRGKFTEIGNYTNKVLSSQLSGNIVDLCPVGALTAKPYSFKSRPWELRYSESIDLTDSFGSNIYINFKDVSVFRILPKPIKNLNGSLLTDNARYFFDSLTSQRLFRIYEKSYKNNKLALESSEKISLEKLGLFNQKVLNIIDAELSLEVINLFKLLSFKKANTFKLRSVSNFDINQTNFFYSSFKNNEDLINLSNIIIFFASNLYLESSILNSKIRVKFIKEDLQIFKLGGNFWSNFTSPCINLNLSLAFKLFEGKIRSFSSLLALELVPLIIIGESIKSRGLNSLIFKEVVDTFFFHCKFLNISKKCNSVGLQFSGIKPVTKQILTNSNLVNIINLKESLQLFKNLSSTKSVAWWNTHGPLKLFKALTFLIPLGSYLNETGSYINLEERAQSVKSIFPVLSESTSRYYFSLKTELIKLLNVNLISKFAFFQFYKDIIKYFDIFIFTPKFYFYKQVYSYNVSFLPIKFYLEDPYLASKNTLGSKILAGVSLSFRNTKNNFLILNSHT